MEQLDLFTGQVSRYPYRNRLYISSKSNPAGLELFLSRLNVLDVGITFLGNALMKLPISPNYKAPCPLHAERTPSFYIKPEHNFYICYGCGSQGGPLNLWYRLDCQLGRSSLDNLVENCGLPRLNIFSPWVDLASFSEEQRQCWQIFSDALRREGL